MNNDLKTKNNNYMFYNPRNIIILIAIISIFFIRFSDIQTDDIGFKFILIFLNILLLTNSRIISILVFGLGVILMLLIGVDVGLLVILVSGVSYFSKDIFISWDIANKYIPRILKSSANDSQLSKFILFEVLICMVIYYISKNECYSKEGWNVHIEHNIPDFVVGWGWDEIFTINKQNICNYSALTSVVLLFIPWLPLHILGYLLYSSKNENRDSSSKNINTNYLIDKSSLLKIFIIIIILLYSLLKRHKDVLDTGEWMFPRGGYYLHSYMYKYIPIAYILFLILT